MVTVATLRKSLTESYEHGGPLRDGLVADYIPQLASVDPDRFGMATCSLDGDVVEVGDADVPFTMQSTVKPFLFALALSRFGDDVVLRRVGVEPTGQEFDAFTRLEAGQHRPSNPMVNAGAIAITDLLLSDFDDPAAGVDDILRSLGNFAGRPLRPDAEVLESERAHGARNRVIAHLMKHFGLITEDVESALTTYFSACSIEVTCRDLAVMASTLAGAGRTTGDALLSPAHAGLVLTVMATCGMYDASGRFALEVGLPAKSGVSGGIVAVAPGRCGVAAFSPRLDAAGNSVRGWAALRRFSAAIDGHILGCRHPWISFTPTRVLEHAVRRARQAARAQTGGRPADYLPRGPASPLGVAMCTADGEEYTSGDASAPISLQAVANPLALGHALARFGETRVRRLVGEEPSGNPFHAILIDRGHRRPFNAMGNAGAIAIAGLNLENDGSVDRYDPQVWVASLAGLAAPCPVDDAVLEAEHAHAHRNRAIASLLREFGIVQDTDAAVDLYLRQCATTVTLRDLARIGAVLARGGIDLSSGRRVLPSRVVTDVLTVMYTCGMHDQSGRFAMEVGVPAKSGISGGILAVVPGEAGIAVLSPRVDVAGTSVPGRTALRHLSRILGLSVLGRAPDGGPGGQGG